MAELEEYIDNTGDMQLSMMVHMVKKYGRRIPQILEELKGKHVSDEDKHKAEMIFSTVHRCKGMEYDCVELTPDFIKEEQIQETERGNKEPISPEKLNEEINLLYVAVTRARNLLYLPDALIPFVTLPTDNIKILENEISQTGNLTPLIFQKRRTTYKKAYEPWTTELDDELTTMYCNGVSVEEMAVHFERTYGAIRSRIKKLELEELYG